MVLWSRDQWISGSIKLDPYNRIVRELWDQVISVLRRRVFGGEVRTKVVLSKVGHLAHVHLKIVLFTYLGRLYFEFLMKNLWHHNYTNIISFCYNLVRKCELSPTFLIYFDWNLLGIIFRILVLKLSKRNVFTFQKRQ